MIQFDESGWLSGVEHVHSDNYNLRPIGTLPSLIVIHCISLPPAQYGGHYIHQFFQNQLDSKEHDYFKTISDLKVSCHFLIERDGKITQFVSANHRAWHAGESCFKDLSNCNDYSIGIELEGTDDSVFEKIQYTKLKGLIRQIQNQYPQIPVDGVVAHSDIAPLRKTDPGKYFDWSLIGIGIKND